MKRARRHDHGVLAWLALLVALVIIEGCVAVRVSQDYDPTSAAFQKSTWQWELPTQPQTGDLRIDNPLLTGRIREAIHDHLTARNFVQSQQAPGLYVSHNLVIQPRLQSYASTPGWGMGGYSWVWGLDTDVQVYQYDECRLTIDIKAADTETLFWRGTGEFRLRTYKTPQAAAADMQRIVDRILDQFPPIQ